MTARSLAKKVARATGMFTFLREAETVAACIMRRVHDEDFRRIPRDIGTGEIIDVGANLGQSIGTLRALFGANKIISFEPNPYCMRSLNRVQRVLRNIEVRNYGIGESSAVLAFYTPVLADGTMLLQEGSFDEKVFRDAVTRARIGAEFSLRVQQIEIITLDSLKLAPSLVKIDVQGLELQVLRGAAATIAAHRPHVFLEMESGSFHLINQFMADFNYVGYPLGVNCLFVPS